MNSDDFVIVGAGSVGLFAAITAVDRGFRVRVLDGKPGPRTPTYAVPLHPRTLELLDGAGVLGPLAPRACRVNRITIHHGRDVRAELDLASLKAPFPFILTVGLDVLEQALYQTLAARGVEVFWDHRVETITQELDGVQVAAVRADHTRWTGRASSLVGADGCHSQTRTRTNLGYREMAPAATYLLLEGEAPAELGQAIRVGWYGTRVSSIWPLPGGRAALEPATSGRRIEQARGPAYRRGPGDRPAGSRTRMHTPPGIRGLGSHRHVRASPGEYAVPGAGVGGRRRGSLFGPFVGP